MKNQQATSAPLNDFVIITLDDRPLKIIFDFNALAAIEDQTGLSALQPDFWRQLLSPIKAGTVRMLLWAGLRTHHPEMTVEQIGSMLSGKNLQQIIEGLLEAQKRQSQSGEDEKRPTVAASVAAQ